MTITFSDSFYQQTRLLLEVLHLIRSEPIFALKGGTAINFFVQNMPRLSVDIDLAYQSLLPRENALENIYHAMARIANAVQAHHPNAQIKYDKRPQTLKLTIYKQNTAIKIEINPVFRGSVFPSEVRALCQAASDLFEISMDTHTTSVADLYAGKFCAALNRQHPRDLFDVKLFFEQNIWSPEIRQAFVIYLAADRRPPHELLLPNIKSFAEQEQLFKQEFLGMVQEKMIYQDLVPVLPQLVATIKQHLTSEEKQFLLSIIAGEPEWKYLPFSHLQDLPALQWKVLNVKKMDAQKRRLAIDALTHSFSV